MKSAKKFLQLASGLAAIAFAAWLLASCSANSAAAAGRLNDGTFTICHTTGDTTTPYELLTLPLDELVAHADDKDDIIPAPTEGCPETLVTNSNPRKLTICHATGSATEPYNQIALDFNGLRAHVNHMGDFIPAPQNGCPLLTPTPDLTALATSQDKKITICHATGSDTNPFVLITVSLNGLNGHGDHTDDIIPAPAGGCPTQ
jgi:hypothetical protein